MILRIILIGLLIYVLIKVASLAIRSFKTQWVDREDQTPLSDRRVSEMVRDPVCGMYITRNEALSTVHKGEKIHFCSAECHQKYISDHQV